jgi:cysteine synthase
MDTATNQLLPAHDPDPLLRTIGHTPLGALRSAPRVHLKLEGLNLTGSVNIRLAYRMIRTAEVAGQLTEAKIILDATSGNTGIVDAFIAARRGGLAGLVHCPPREGSSHCGHLPGRR